MLVMLSKLWGQLNFLVKRSFSFDHFWKKCWTKEIRFLQTTIAQISSILRFGHTVTHKRHAKCHYHLRIECCECLYESPWQQSIGSHISELTVEHLWPLNKIQKLLNTTAIDNSKHWSRKPIVASLAKKYSQEQDLNWSGYKEHWTSWKMVYECFSRLLSMKYWQLQSIIQNIKWRCNQKHHFHWQKVLYEWGILRLETQ